MIHKLKSKVQTAILRGGMAVAVTSILCAIYLLHISTPLSTQTYIIYHLARLMTVVGVAVAAQTLIGYFIAGKSAVLLGKE